MKEKLFDELKYKAKSEHLTDYLVNLIYSKPMDPGDKDMIGLFDSYCYLKTDTEENVYEVYDSSGDLLFTIDYDGFINQRSNLDFTYNHQELLKLVDSVLIFVESDKLIKL